MSESAALLELQNVSREFTEIPGGVRVLDGVDLTLGAGEAISVVGPSGCGKSTLLNLIGGLDRPTRGRVLFRGEDIASLPEKALAHYRNASVGFVFQLHHLLPQCTALENVLVPTLVNDNPSGARGRAEELLARVGLADRMDYRPGRLSGGERQRVAVVRALINRPALLLADEPTGSLSPDAAQDLAQLLLDLNAESEMALVVVTHSEAVAQSVGTVLEFHDGHLRPHAGVGA